jgi:SAM-dependent methyltransferase
MVAGDFWDNMWSSASLPTVVDPSDPFTGAIVSKMASYIPSGARTILELGGAPGGWLAYFARQHGLCPVALERSAIGCERTRENWRLLGVAGEVIQADLFADSPTGRFDVVYSLGLIEHFDDLEYVVQQHLKYLKPEGALMLGCPNWRGVYRTPISRLTPHLLSIHNLETMDVNSWDGFEESLGLTRLFRGYVGGFEPSIYSNIERPGFAPYAIARAAGKLSKLLRFPVLRALHRFNHPAISGYILGAYTLPAVRASSDTRAVE